jgi:hypothetical protein
MIKNNNDKTSASAKTITLIVDDCDDLVEIVID